MNKKKICEILNGKRVVWRNSEGKELPALCIAPPDTNSVSVKPYGLTPKQIQKAHWWRTIKEIEHPSFCFANLKFDNAKKDILYLASLNEGEVFAPFEMGFDNTGLGGKPTCPFV